MAGDPAGVGLDLGQGAARVLGRMRSPGASPSLAGAARVRGERALARLETAFLRFDRLLGRALPPELNPFLQTGAVAITSLIVATVTGVALLVWYRPSLHLAYDSVAAMSQAPWSAGLLRSLHRYSSDAAVFFALVHALRLLLERRIDGPRWLAWVTGCVALAIVWIVGWTGYWLVWDARAQAVAVGTARVLDALPIFAEPMGRSFLVDSGVNSLLFFVVFFVHMLVPLALAIALWLHLVRIARPRFLTATPVTVWVLGSLLLLSLAYPAGSAAPARMTALGQTYSMDWWYLAPLVVSDRLSGGALWALLLVGGAIALSVPLWAVRRIACPAHVDAGRCNACMQCWQDCPYEAITMIPRVEGRERYPVQAHVDPAKCVGCGICSGSCDSIGVGVDWLAQDAARERIERWLAEAAPAGGGVRVALACAHSAGGGLHVDGATGACPELPGYRVLQVPCAGWIHTLTLERALRRGASDALVVSCPPGACHYREGERWIRERVEGERTPALRVEMVARERIHLLPLARTATGELVRMAGEIRRTGHARGPSRPGAALSGAASVALALGVAGALGVVSDLGYAAPRPEGSELVVTFKHPGHVSDECRELSPEEQAARPRHMRRERICARERAPVRLRVTLDGERVVERSYPPSGIWGDGSSIAVEPFAVAPGRHRVRVEIGDEADDDEWNHAMEQELEFGLEARRVVTFDKLVGFGVH